MDKENIYKKVLGSDLDIDHAEHKCSGKCACEKTTKKHLLELIDDVIKTSKDIRVATIDYIKSTPFGKDIDMLEHYLMNCSFKDFKEIVEELPEIKKVKELQKLEFFKNPDDGELLQVWSLTINGDTCIMEALRRNNSVVKYVFDKDRVVVLPE